MKKALLLLVLFVQVTAAQAQMNIYSALTIPDSLKKDADMVVRDEYIKVLIKDKNTARQEVHQVITVLNEQGKDFLIFRMLLNKFKELDDAEIKVYDVLGNKKSTYSQKEMTSLNYGEDLVPNGKLTYFEVSAPSYPITVEFNYTIRFKGILGLPAYFLHPSWQSVQHSVFEVDVSSEIGVRYKLVNTNSQPETIHSGSKDIYRWEQKNLTPFKIEKHSGSPDNYLPHVLLAPNKFQLDDYDGDMTSWKNFGDWINNLYAKTTALPDEKKQFYQAMVKNASTDREKAQILYSYLQNNMRYVSIQLGIGGFRPFPASFVDEKKYGDCKALSNYLKSTLDAVGIKSNLIIIYRDYEPKIVDEKFPMNDFNHVILCIPQQADTIWLECTSTTLPFSKLDETTLNRKGMMITNNGGVLVNTPLSSYQNNTGITNTIIEVNDAGGANVNTVCTLKGEERDNLLMRFHDLKDDEKKKYFITEKEWKQPDHFEITASPNKSNPYVVNTKMEYEKIYSFTAGSKLFFEPRLYPFFDEDIPENTNRIRDYYFTCPYQVFDTTVYKFPVGYNLENMPKNKSVTKPFAEYSCTYTWDAGKRILIAVAMLQLKERVIKAADYLSLYDFKKQVMTSVNEKIVMKKE
jgi:transglutaminase-like putative cysteine protease